MNRPFNMPDEFVEAFVKAGASLWGSLGSAAPGGGGERFAELQADYLKRWFQLTQAALTSAAGAQSEAAIEPTRGDRRFNGTEWRDSALHSLLKQSYLLNARYCTEFVEAL